MKKTYKESVDLLINSTVSYLIKHPKEEKFLFFKLHTNQGKATSLLIELKQLQKDLKSTTTTIPNFLQFAKGIYEDYIKDKNGELMENLLGALNSIIPVEESSAALQQYGNPDIKLTPQDTAKILLSAYLNTHLAVQALSPLNV